MNKTKTKISTRPLINPITKLIISLTVITQILLTGCASVQHRDDSIHAILKKENELIKKIKAERLEENLQRALNQSETLRRAEVHLSMSFDEILKANEVVITKLINQNKEEVKNGKNERVND